MTLVSNTGPPAAPASVTLTNGRDQEARAAGGGWMCDMMLCYNLCRQSHMGLLSDTSTPPPLLPPLSSPLQFDHQQTPLPLASKHTRAC
jgi:hypothetical protein